MQSILWAATGTGFTFLMTTLGAAMVFLFRKQLNASIQRIFLGFAAGVMIAASVWSLLIPAMEEAEASGLPGWLPAVGGFVLGIGFLLLLDVLLPHLHVDARQPEGLHSSWRRTTLLVLAVTLHNIPEGMAVGLSFALAAQHAGEGAALSGALALALGIGIQNFPEGAAISLPLRQEGLSAGRAFLYGSASGVVEPVFGILVVLVAGTIQPLMPWLLSFAAGAMLYVVVEELIPEAHLGEHSNTGTLGVMAGFLLWGGAGAGGAPAHGGGVGGAVGPPRAPGTLWRAGTSPAPTEQRYPDSSEPAPPRPAASDRRGSAAGAPPASGAAPGRPRTAAAPPHPASRSDALPLHPSCSPPV